MDLNREVAEKIMGYEFRKSSPDPKKYFCRTYGNDSGWFKAPGYKGWSCLKCIFNFNPLEDLNQCFEVVEKLRKKEWFFNFSNEMTDKYWAEFWRDEYTEGHQIYAKTPNEAILKAALEAVKE